MGWREPSSSFEITSRCVPGPKTTATISCSAPAGMGMSAFNWACSSLSTSASEALFETSLSLSSCRVTSTFLGGGAGAAGPASVMLAEEGAKVPPAAVGSFTITDFAEGNTW
jgi:hypothetical protein